MGARSINHVTLADISEKTGVAPSTVSAILNESPSCFAGKAAREKVVSAAREMGYYPNLLYRGMRAGKTSTIGLIVPSFYFHVTLSSIELIESLAWDAGYNVFIGYSGDSVAKEEALLRDFVSRRVDGIILIAGGGEGRRPELERLIGRKFPIVVIGRQRGYELNGACVVSTDYYEGGSIAARHLLELGHVEVAAVCFSSYEKSLRIRGFLDEAGKLGAKTRITVAGMEKKSPLSMTERLVEAGFRMGEKALRGGGTRPSAVFAQNDEIAAGVVRAAVSLGLDVPGELSVVGFDDSPIAGFSAVPLTTVRQKREEISRHSFKRLMDLAEGGRGSVRGRTITPELIVRESTGRSKNSRKNKGKGGE